MSRQRYSKFEKKSFPFVYLLILLPVVQFLVFWLYVNIRSISLAFIDNRDGFFTLEYFGQVFYNMVNPVSSGGETIFSMIGRSVLLWVIANVIGLPLGLACTYVMYRKIIGHYAYRVIYAIPIILGSVIWVGLLKEICTGSGPVIYLLTKMGINPGDEAISEGLFAKGAGTGFPTLIIIMFLQSAIGGGVIATSAFSKVPKDLFEAAEMDGIGFWGQFIHVAIPCAWPTISTLITVALCSLLVVDGNVYLFTNGTGGDMPTMGYYLYSLSVGISEQITKGSTVINYGYPSAVGLTITLISVPIVLIGRKLLGRVWSDVKI